MLHIHSSDTAIHVVSLFKSDDSSDLGLGQSQHSIRECTLVSFFASIFDLFAVFFFFNSKDVNVRSSESHLNETLQRKVLPHVLIDKISFLRYRLKFILEEEEEKQCRYAKGMNLPLRGMGTRSHLESVTSHRGLAP